MTDISKMRSVSNKLFGAFSARSAIGNATMTMMVCKSTNKTYLPMMSQLWHLNGALIARSYHTSHMVMSKNKKGGNQKGKGNDDEAAPAVKMPELKNYEKTMDGTINWMTNEFAKLKVGRVSVDMFSNLPVESYGTVGKAGQVTLKSNTKLVVSVYDPTMAKPVADAIKDCGLNLNPTIEGSNVMATIPRPSKESRDLMVKAATKLAEKVMTLLTCT